MKRTLSFILTLVMVTCILTSVPVTVNAASVDDLTFELNEDGKSYSVYACDTSAKGKLTIPAEYNAKPVTVINDSAFRDCTNITLFIIPDSIISIGGYAFYNTGYYNNESNWDNGALYIDNHLVKVKENLSGAYTIKSGTKSIATYAFASCEYIVSITIPKSLNNIGYFAFRNCKNLVSVEIPESVTNIESGAFYGCSSLKTISLPDSVEFLGYSAFYGCTNLSNVIIGSNVTGIYDSTFEGCSSLSSINIPASVTVIGKYAFGDCTKLATIKIPDSVTSIGNGAFGNTSYYNNESNWDNGVLYINNHLISANDKINNDYMVRKGTKTIARGAFSFSNINSIKIPNGITEINSDVFLFCVNLKSIYLPKTLKNIEYEAFHFANVSDIYYSGNEEDWAKISIDYSNNDVLKNAKIHYNCPCDHISSGWITDSKATVYKAGSKHKECTVCGATIKNAAIPQLKCVKPVLKKVYNANSYVKVTWGTVEGADLYRVYRKTGTGSYEYIGSTKNTYFNDKEAGAGKTCRYRIRALNEAGYSEYSVSIAIKHIDEPNLKSIENSAYGVLIKWDKVTGAQKYSVYRKVSGGEYEYIGATTNAYYTDKNAKSGTKYYYAIRGKRDDSISSQSASLSKYHLADPTLNTPTSTTSGIKLSWSKVTGAEGYIVYRKTDSGSYSKIATVKGVSKVSYTDKTAKKGTKYTYKIKVYKSKTYSIYSNAKAIIDKY